MIRVEVILELPDSHAGVAFEPGDAAYAISEKLRQDADPNVTIVAISARRQS